MWQKNLLNINLWGSFLGHIGVWKDTVLLQAGRQAGLESELLGVYY
jgi:hypothetical protein